MDRYPFAVGASPYCTWEHDLAQRNERFLSAMDSEYYSYLATRLFEDLDGENAQRAAVALRTNYFHGLETLFSLLGAMAQAPGCVVGWIPKCSNTQLREVVQGFIRGRLLLTQVGSQHITLDNLAEATFAYAWNDETPPKPTQLHFASLWKRLATDFLDPHYVSEYNSLKHGFRVSAGGFVVRVGLEETFGVPAPEAAMQTIGGSTFGTSFYEDIPVPDETSPRHNFRLRRMSLNWRADSMAGRLQLIGMSINNVVGAIRCLNGAPPGTIKYLRPVDPADFEAPWRLGVGVTSSNMDFAIDPSEITAESKQALLAELTARS